MAKSNVAAVPTAAAPEKAAAKKAARPKAAASKAEKAAEKKAVPVGPVPKKIVEYVGTLPNAAKEYARVAARVASVGVAFSAKRAAAVRALASLGATDPTSAVDKDAIAAASGGVLASRAAASHEVYKDQPLAIAGYVGRVALGRGLGFYLTTTGVEAARAAGILADAPKKAAGKKVAPKKAAK